MDTQQQHTHGHEQGMLPNWSRPPFGRAPTHRRATRNTTVTTLQSLNKPTKAPAKAGAQPPKIETTEAEGPGNHQIEFLQQEHQAVLGSLAAEVENLKMENRDLKFRLVMRDTATPDQRGRTRPQASSAGTSESLVEKLRKENAELNERNTTLVGQQAQQAAGADGGGAAQELQRLNQFNCNLVAEVAALRHELNQTRVEMQGGSDAHAHAHVRVHRGGRNSVDGGAGSMVPMDTPHAMQQQQQQQYTQQQQQYTQYPHPADPTPDARRARDHALAIDGGALLPAKMNDGAPRFISRQRSGGGTTSRKLNAPPQVHHLPSLNLGLGSSKPSKRAT